MGANTKTYKRADTGAAYRVCPKCEEEKPLSAFYVNNQGDKGNDTDYFDYCKKCKTKQIRAAQSIPYEERPGTKSVNPEQVRIIRRYFDAKMYTQQELARMFSISQPLVSQIVRYRTVKNEVTQ